MNDREPAESPHQPSLRLADNSSTVVSTVTSELIFAFVAAVGVNLAIAEEAAEARLKDMGYQIIRVRVTDDVLPFLDARAGKDYKDKYFERVSNMMDAGNLARKKFGNAILADGIAAAIRKRRSTTDLPSKKVAYFVHSLKHPEEVHRLRELYPRGFYLVGVHAPPDTRRRHLIYERNLTATQAKELMERDKQEPHKFGQNLVETFHLADFFAGWQDSRSKKETERYRQFLENNVARFIDIAFSHPNKTPTFGEYAMFLAFSASLRSADLSRQVGAVITREREILSAGANDCPKPNGGLYWPTFNPESLTFDDVLRGRDWTRGEDSNRAALIEIKKHLLDDAVEAFGKLIRSNDWETKIDQASADQFEGAIRKLLSHSLERSQISDLTEFGRVVHAEMEALLSCARKGISTIGSSLFSTTFPCHNCAKHIVAAGVDRVVFIEPYLKSRAMTLHDDSIELSYPNPLRRAPKERPTKVQFEPFVGVGPRRFFDLFSMNMGAGTTLKRKEGPAKARKWSPSEARVRIEMAVDSYLDREAAAAAAFDQKTSRILP
jgi:deoxycytidylate deaminase